MDTVKIALEGEFAGWTAELRKQVTARILLDLESGDSSRSLHAFSKLVVTHNFKGLDGKPVDDVLDAPVDALTQTLSCGARRTSRTPSKARRQADGDWTIYRPSARDHLSHLGREVWDVAR